MRHRLLAGVAAAGLGVLLVAPGADAAPADWAGSRVTTGAHSDRSSFSIDSEIHRKFNQGLGENVIVKTTFTTPGGLAPGCPGASTVELSTATLEETPNVPDQFLTTAPVTVSCNGTYTFTVQATLDRRLQGDEQAPPLPGTVVVAVPPAPVDGIEHTLSEGAVLLQWSAGDQAADFEGFQVSRRDGEEWTTLADGLQSNEFADTTPPPAGGDVRYRIRARRSSPEGTLYSTGGAHTVNMPSNTTTTTPGGGDGGTTAGTDGGATAGTDGGGTAAGTAGTDGGGTAGTAGTDGGGTGGTSRTGRTFTTLPRGRVGVGTKIGVVPQSNYDDLYADADPGFDEELDYGEDGLASGEDDNSYFSYENTAGRGMAVPVATGFVLAAWAFHLRFLARAAKPAKVARPPRHRPSY